MKWYSIPLYPFSLLYGSILAIRNGMFDVGVFSSYKIQKPAINVGNLSVGGTGKSPHVMYLVELLKEEFHVATLSRGYGRRTKGFYEVKESHSAEEVGDEPLMFKHRLKEAVRVTVDENRRRTALMLDQKKDVDVVILDDAYQHRKVEAGLNILLTEFNQPYFEDFVLPSGRLREFKCGKKRADLVIVTKTPSSVTEEVKRKYISKIAISPQKIFFSSIQYGSMIGFGKLTESPKSVLLVTGIAHPDLLKKYLAESYIVDEIRYPDHHNFTRADLAQIHSNFDKFEDAQARIVTTEKDFVRIYPLLTEEEKLKYPWYFQSIEVKIDREKAFNELIIDYVRAIPTIG